MELLQTTPLCIPAILQKAAVLSATGYLVRTADNLVALKIADDYIHQLCPLLQGEGINKPDYFGEQGIGAHISIIYPEEYINFNEKLLEQEHFFKINNLLIAKIIAKKYYILTVEAPTLLALRKQYELPAKLCFKKYWIDFHITIGMSEC